MKQLAGMDNFYLMSEHGNVYNHVAMLGIYDPSTSPTGKVRVKDVMEHFRKRLHISPVFSQRLVTPPFGIDRPYWIADPDIDLEFHIRHIALPHPGDWRQLMIQVARLHSRPLDRTRPLWEIYIIEGLDQIDGMPKGAFALFIKLHHSSVDGMAASGLIKRAHSASPDDKAYQSDSMVRISDREPMAVEYVSRALGHTIDRITGLARFALKSTGRAASITRRLIEQQRNPASGALDMEALRAAGGYGKAPDTRFNRKLSANRIVEAVGFSMDDIGTIRKHIAGATVNDIFLAVAGGAVRGYLKTKDELPSESLRALMPISLRAAGDAAAAKGGNEVGGVAVLLHSEIADPIERLHTIKHDVAKAKAGAELVGPDMVIAIYNELPFALSNFLVKRLVLDQLNCTVSNVRGPDEALYIAGAKAVHMYPVSIPIDNVGLNFTGFSYNHTLWISAVACRNIVPDPAFMAQSLKGAFNDLLEAAKKLAIPEKPAAPKAGATGAATASAASKVKKAATPKPAAAKAPTPKTAKAPKTPGAPRKGVTKVAKG